MIYLLEENTCFTTSRKLKLNEYPSLKVFDIRSIVYACKQVNNHYSNCDIKLVIVNIYPIIGIKI